MVLSDNEVLKFCQVRGPLFQVSRLAGHPHSLALAPVMHVSSTMSLAGEKASLDDDAPVPGHAPVSELTLCGGAVTPDPSGPPAAPPPPPPPPLPPLLGTLTHGLRKKRRVRSFYWKTIPEEKVKGKPNIWTMAVRQQQYQIDVRTVEELFGQQEENGAGRSPSGNEAPRRGRSRASFKESKDEVRKAGTE